MADSNNQRPHRAYDPHGRAADADRNAADDPLAELARLIGQSDPFGDLERRAGAEGQRTPQAAPSQEWRQESSPVPPAPHPEAYVMPPGAAPYEGIPQAGAPQAYPEQYPEGTYTPYPEQAAAYPEEAYGYPPEAYEGYEAYYGDDGQPIDGAEYYAQQEQQQRRRRRLAAVVAILTLAVVGGGGAYGYRTFFASGTSSAPPPVIKADTSPAKVMPTQGADAASNKLIYDRVGERNQAERVMPREEKPIDIKTASVTQAPRAIYPGPNANAAASPPATVPVSGRNTGGQVLPVANSPSIGQGSGAILPSAKKVRTVTIRPDMTIVPDAAASSPDPTPPPAKPAETPQPPRPTAVPASPPSEPARAAPARNVAAAPSPTPAAPGPARSAPPPSQSTSGPLSLSPNDPAPAPAPAPPAPARAAQQPLSLASVPPASSGDTRAGTAPSSGNFAVQVSSQRSEAEANAAYRTLQSRYPTVLAGRSSFVRRADLGSRGIYYRTMVGPFTSAEQAAQLCGSLKAAGGQCIVHRN